MKTLSIDLETFSDINIGKSGVYRYADSPNFNILLFGYSIDGSPVELIDLACGEELPEYIIKALLDEKIIKTAFNAQFERVCLMKYLSRLLNKDTYLDPLSWSCSEVQASMLGLPLNLAGVGKVLKLDDQKMAEGKALIRYFCIPCKPTAANGGRTRNMPSDAPEKWELFKQYNIRDVEVELSIREKLSDYPISDKEQEFYVLDQRINDQGLLVDMNLVDEAISCDRQFTVAATERAYELTGLENPNSVSQLKSWLKDRGVEVESLSKKTVTELVEENEGEVEEALRLRLLMAKTSVKKYEAVERAVCSDGRVHGLFQFYGANRTGRWCLAKGTPVRVKTTDDRVMEKAIEEVMLTDQVWDGDQWVSHEGVVYSGDKEVITWDGVTATPEHIVYISDDGKISLGEAKERGIPLWKGNLKSTK
ncbi:MAG: DNA polymerase [Clostridiaceae bacterium]